MALCVASPRLFVPFANSRRSNLTVTGYFGHSSYSLVSKGETCVNSRKQRALSFMENKFFNDKMYLKLGAKPAIGMLS